MRKTPAYGGEKWLEKVFQSSQINNESLEGVPVLGDRVFVGPGACVFGPISIGNDVAIGANAVVTKSLSDRAVAVGIPAHVSSYKGSFFLRELFGHGYRSKASSQYSITRISAGQAGNSVIGQKIASLEAAPRSWVQRIWGIPDIHTRQKWTALYPYLFQLPGQIRLLDAGCGNGTWSFELAKRHPSWTVVGIDKDGEAINRAERDKFTLMLRNVTFVESDFLNFNPIKPFDVVLSVASAHYLAEMDKGQLLFGWFQQWLKPQGNLVLLVPRRDVEIPLAPFLPPLPSHPVFTKAMIETLCQSQGFQIDMIKPCVGLFGTTAKQIAQLPSKVPLQRSITYPIQQLLCFLDRFSKVELASSFYVVIAHKPPEEQ